MSAPPTDPRWPDQIAALCQELVALPADGPAPARDACKSALWLLLHDALTRFMDRQASRVGRVDRTDLEDLAAGKALDLLLNAESGKWDVYGRTGAEIAAFLSTVARNALIDWHRRRRREVSVADFETGLRHDGGEAEGPLLTDSGATGYEALERVAAGQFVVDLKSCAEKLAPRSRWAWFLRVFHEMPTRSIASHPAVNLKPGHVDVLLQRCRKAIRECMEQRGHDTDQLPPGTFVALWSALRGVEGGPDDERAGEPAGAMDEPF